MPKYVFLYSKHNNTARNRGENLLFYIQNEPFQVLSFGVININRMVRCLVKLVKYSHFSFGFGGSGEHGKAELLLVDSLRATEREKDASVGDLGYGLSVESSVSPKCTFYRVQVLGKGRWIQDNHVVEFRLHSLEELERILCIGLVDRYVRKVQIYVLTGDVDSFGGAPLRA